MWPAVAGVVRQAAIALWFSRWVKVRSSVIKAARWSSGSVLSGACPIDLVRRCFGKRRVGPVGTLLCNPLS